MKQLRTAAVALVTGLAALSGTCGAAQLTSASGSAAAVASSSQACAPRGAQIRAQNHHGRVYALHGGLFACSLVTGRSFRLGGLTNCLSDDLAGPAVLAEGIVAFASERCGIDTGSTRIFVRRLSDARPLHTGDAFRAPGVESHTSVKAIVAKSDGAVAWIAVAHSIGGRGGVEVARIDSRGETVLDGSPRVATRSLRLSGSRLTWRRGGSVVSATLR